MPEPLLASDAYCEKRIPAAMERFVTGTTQEIGPAVWSLADRHSERAPRTLARPRPPRPDHHLISGGTSARPTAPITTTTAVCHRPMWTMSLNGQ